LPGAVGIALIVGAPGVPGAVAAQFALRPLDQPYSRTLLASRDGRAQAGVFAAHAYVPGRYGRRLHWVRLA
jgi:hypothetical protein